MAGTPIKRMRREAAKPNPNRLEKWAKSKGKPAFGDPALLKRLEERLRKGASFATAFKCEGLSPNLMSVWKGHLNKYDADPGLISPNVDIVSMHAAVVRLDRARAEAAFQCEQRVHQGSPNYLHWLERMERGEWLPEKQKIELTSIEGEPENRPLDANDIRKILGVINLDSDPDATDLPEGG